MQRKEIISMIFYNSLPIAGLDGTLLKRFKLKPLYKNMRAKTGYIKGVSSLSMAISMVKIMIYIYFQ